MEFIGHLDLDAFFARCEELKQPELEGKPVVVCVYTRNSSSGAVSTCNYEARELGIGSGMPLSEAKSRANDETVFLPVDRDFYSRKSRQVMDLLPGEIHQTSVDEAYFRLEEQPVKTAEKIKQEIEEHGLTASIGIAPNKFVAKMASEEDKPDGLTFVEEDDVEEFLEEKPVGDLHGVGSATEEKLNSIGIEDCSDLRAADNAHLAAEFGSDRAASLKARAYGRGSKKFEETEQKQISKIKTMEKNSSNYRAVRKELEEAVEELWNRIERKEKAFQRVTVILIDTDLQTYTRSRKIKTSDTHANLFKEADKLLKEFMEGEDRVLRRIGVRASDLVDVKKQTSLQKF